MDKKEFKKQKEIEIKKLSEVIDFLENLLEENTSVSLIKNNETEKLYKIINKSKNLLHKLKSDEFEIAVVGLEKAGKSTFVNALIENDILPSAPERCTFTSTKLTYGKEDKAIVEFYTEEEFNAIFQELLKDIDYPNWGKQSYKALSLDEFNRYFESLEEKNPSLFKSHQGKTDEEIRDILKVKDKLILTGEIKEFSKDELNSDIFKAYIKGENKGQDTSKPRSTKRVEIFSSKLNKLQTAIIYDVPGFDSPTKIHERQTLERLKKADAIILITNVGRNPSLLGTQLNIITKNSDEDGIPLRDKLFVFGNQIDLVNKASDIESNVEILKRDVVKYNIGKKERVFFGSAYKYLIDKKIIEDKEFSTRFEFDNSGVKLIHKSLIDYYQNDRFSILKRKIEQNKDALRDIFITLLQNTPHIEPKDYIEEKRANIIIEATKNIEKNIKANLLQLKHELKKEIWDEKYFSKKFNEQIESNNYFNEIDEELVEKVSIERDNSITQDIPIERINHAIREELHKKFLKEYTDLIINITDTKTKEIEKRIINSIIDAIGYTDESEIKKFILSVSFNNAHNEKQFIYLIERFSRNIFDILSYPLGSEDRVNKFKEAKNEFIYLDEFFSGKGDLISLILTAQNKSFSLTQLPKEIIDILDFLNSIHLSPANIPNMKKTIQSKVKSLSELLSSELSKVNKTLDYLEILKSVNRSTTKDAVLLEINIDIESLKDILKKGVVPATNLELAFLNAIDKQIQSIVSSIDEPKFREFISKVILKKKSNELSSLANELELYKLKQELIFKIKEFEGKL